MGDWLCFYEQFFDARVNAEHFVEACEEVPPSANSAKIMMHQTQRLVSICDELGVARRVRVTHQEGPDRPRKLIRLQGLGFCPEITRAA